MIIATLGLIWVAGVAGDEIILFLTAGAEVFAIILIAVLAHLSMSRTNLRPVVIFLTIVILAILAIFSFGYANAETLMVENAAGDMDITQTMIVSLLLSFIFWLAPLIFYDRRIRERISLYIPINPDDFVHTTALVLISGASLLFMLPLLILGEPPLLLLAGQTDAPESFILARTELYRLMWAILGSFLAVGYLTRKTLAESIRRLGLTFPTPRRTGIGVLAGIVFVPLLFGLNRLTGAVFTQLGWPLTDEAAVILLFAAYMTPLAAIAASISAGFGEEIAMRGVLQPRFGIVIAALVFTAAHALQYGWDALIGVFIAGCLFGVLRKRTDTLVACVAHATYNMIIFSLYMQGILP